MTNWPTFRGGSSRRTFPLSIAVGGRSCDAPKLRVRAAAAVLAACVAAPHSDALAAGYAVGQESVTGMGVAYAGGAAAANDVSTVFYNPAGLTRIGGSQVIWGGASIFPSIQFREQNSTLFDGTTISGGEGGNGGQNALIPHFYGVYTASNGIKYGLGINSPFGLVTNYEDGWKGRYSEITTSLKGVNVNPSVAGIVAPGLSVGAGASLQFLRAKLLQSIDFGSNCAQVLNAGDCLTNFGIAPGQSDGSGKVRGDAFGIGFNIGVLYEPTEGTRFGAHYRSRMNFNFDGKGKFAIPQGARAFLNAVGLPDSFGIANAKFTLVEPEMASVSAYHALTDKWAVMADITWTRWAVFDKLKILFDDQTTTNLLETKWDNVFRYSLGATYKPSRNLVWRAGVAFDDSPINGDFRGPGIPDSDRIILGLGLGLAVSDEVWMDVGYQHLFFKTGNTRRVSATNSVLSGDFQVNVDVFGVSFTSTW